MRNWYEGFPQKSFSSLRNFINTFSMDCDYSIEEQEVKTMINRIWEEKLGSNQTQVDSSNGIKDDIPFESKDPDNPTTTKMEIGFAPLDLSAFLGNLDELPEAFWNSFKGDHDNVMHQLEWFMTLA